MFLKKVHKSLLVVSLFLMSCSSTHFNETTTIEPELKSVETKHCELAYEGLEQELCTLTVIGKLLEANSLTPKHCEVISNEQIHADCYSYVSDNNHNLDVCFNIENPELRKSCLGEMRRIFMPETSLKSLDLCNKFQDDNEDLWADQCRVSYVLKNEISDVEVCDGIEYPLAFYNCVKHVSSFSGDSSICSKVREIEPFPKNYPPLVFSVSGCKFWVENNQSYKGLTAEN